LQQMGVRYVQGYLLGQPSADRPWLQPQPDNIVRVGTFTTR